MKWLTWENVGIDRMGCAWLIRRFIDLQAKFLFIPVGQMPLPEGYEPFDIPGVRLTHRRNHCTFHTMLNEYKLDDPILSRIASMIDEADTAQEIAIEPTAAGLDFICRGIRLISADDHTAIEHGRLIYDALYAQTALEHKT
ncbi:MAG: chromate resistance protein [Burkholderiales bacterium]|nr:chromate resistance protein [Anaerolineae bacterium]